MEKQVKVTVKDFISYADFELMPLKQIIGTFIKSVFYIFFGSWIAAASRVPQLVSEIISWKGMSLALIIFLVYNIRKTGGQIDLDSLAMIVAVIFYGGLKTYKDIKYAKMSGGASSTDSDSVPKKIVEG